MASTRRHSSRICATRGCWLARLSSTSTTRRLSPHFLTLAMEIGWMRLVEPHFPNAWKEETSRWGRGRALRVLVVSVCISLPLLSPSRLHVTGGDVDATDLTVYAPRCIYTLSFCVHLHLCDSVLVVWVVCAMRPIPLCDYTVLRSYVFFLNANAQRGIYEFRSIIICRWQITSLTLRQPKKSSLKRKSLLEILISFQAYMNGENKSYKMRSVCVRLSGPQWVAGIHLTFNSIVTMTTVELSYNAI